MFTINHFIWIGICILIIVGLLYLSLKFQYSFKTATYIMAVIAFGSEICKIFTHMQNTQSTGMVLKAEALPFHLCSTLIFVIYYLMFTNNEKNKEILKSLLTPIGILGGTLAILMATSGVEFNKPYPYQCFVYHAGLIWYAIYLIKTKQVDLGIKAYKRNLIILFSLLSCAIWVNSALQIYDTNFFFIVRPPVKNLPILNLNHGWYVYFITIASLGVTLLTLVHLPVIIKEIKNKRGQKESQKE